MVHSCKKTKNEKQTKKTQQTIMKLSSSIEICILRKVVGKPKGRE